MSTGRIAFPAVSKGSLILAVFELANRFRTLAFNARTPPLSRIAGQKLFNENKRLSRTPPPLDLNGQDLRRNHAVPTHFLSTNRRLLITSTPFAAKTDNSRDF